MLVARAAERMPRNVFANGAQPFALPSTHSHGQREKCRQALSPRSLSDEEQTLLSCQEQVWAVSVGAYQGGLHLDAVPSTALGTHSHNSCDKP